jgi:hypothetical protein
MMAQFLLSSHNEAHLLEINNILAETLQRQRVSNNCLLGKIWDGPEADANYNS